MSPPIVAVIVVSWNGARLLPRCLAALRAQRGAPPFQTWVVDNGSTDGTLDLLARDFSAVRVIASPTNRGFAGGNNLALRTLLADPTPPAYVVLLNNDAAPEPGWLAALLRPFEEATGSRVAAVASKVLLYRPGSGDQNIDRDLINSAGGMLTRDGYGADRGWLEPDRGQYDRPAEVFAAPGTAMALRVAALGAVGLLDERFFLYYEDTDLCWRLRLAGWRVHYTPAAVVWHAHAASSRVGSPFFAFHDGRNRLLTLVKNAPAGLALRECARYPLTTLSLAVRARSRADAARVAVRLRVLGSFLQLLSRMLVARREVRRLAVLPRAEVAGWLGVPSPPLPEGGPDLSPPGA